MAFSAVSQAQLQAVAAGAVAQAAGSAAAPIAEHVGKVYSTQATTC